MNDLMLLVQAAELKSSSLETTNFITVETASSSRTTNDTNVESDNAKPAVRPQQPRQEPIYIEIDDDDDVMECDPQASSHQPPQQVSHPTSCTSMRPSSLSTVKDSSRRIEPLVHDWSETSLNKLHDLINQIVPPTTTTTTTTTTTRVGCMSSNDVSTKARNGKIAVPMRGVTVCSPKWKAMFDSLLKYKEEFGNCEVPARWARNKSLAYWVVRQRTLYRRQALPPDKVQLLEDLGFTWDFSLDKYQQELVAKQKASTIMEARRPKTNSDKVRPPLFLTAKQIRHLEQLGLRWDCFQEKKVRFQMEEENESSATMAPPCSIRSNHAIARNPSKLASMTRKPLYLARSQAAPWHAPPAHYPLFFPSPSDYNLWMLHQHRTVQSSCK